MQGEGIKIMKTGKFQVMIYTDNKIHSEVKEKHGDHMWPAKPQIVTIWPFSENTKKLLYQVHKIV